MSFFIVALCSGFYPLCLINHHAMKMYRRVEVQLHALLTLPVDGSESSASYPSCFTPIGKAPATHPIGG